MEKLQMVFIGSKVLINGEHYDSNKVFNFIIDEKKASEKFSVRKNDNGYHKEYIIKIDKDIIVACFASNVENDFTKSMEKWYQKSRRTNIVKLQILSMTLAAGVAVGGLVKHFDDIKETLTQICDEIGFDIENADEKYSIRVLEDEIRAHAGYGEVDGYRQSIEDHNKSYCYLGKDNVSVEEKIEQYCEENVIECISDEACEKFNLLYNGNTEEAYDIKLLDEYKATKQKVHTNN